MTNEKILSYYKIVATRELSFLRTEKETWKVYIDNNKKYAIVYDNAKALMDIYSNLSIVQEKEYFVELLASQITDLYETYITKENRFGVSEEIIPTGVSALCFYTLLQLGYVKEAINAYSIRVQKMNCILVLSVLTDIFKEDYTYFNIDQLNSLTEYFYVLDHADEYTQEIKNKLSLFISENGFSILQNEIKGVNIEINRDKDKLIEKINYFGLDKSYELFLNEIDDYINSNNGLVASGMISNFRSFWEKIIIDLARKLSKILSIEIQKVSESLIGNCRNFIRQYLDLSDSENSLIGKYVEILNAEGGHAFTSNTQYFRLTKNIGIEILLLIVSKISEIECAKS